MKNQNVSRSLGIAIALYTLTCFPPFGGIKGYCQNVGINTTGALPDNSAGLDVDFADKGLLIPRVSLTSTTDAATIASPATSLLVYNTNAAMTGGSVGYWYWDGAQWVQFGTGGGGTAWELLGNAGTVDGTNFIGTTDNIPFNIRVNNERAGRIDNTLANTFFGYRSGNSNSTGNNNTAIGFQALGSNTTGGANTAIGLFALYSNTTGGANTATGRYALYNTTGYDNTAIGYQALLSNITGGSNTAAGKDALRNSTGSWNTAVGDSAGRSNTTGTLNTYLGYKANSSVALTNATAIGANALVTASNSLVLGNAANVGIGTTNPGAKLEVVGTSGTTIKIVDGNQAAGKVLTSDAAGQGSWQPASGGGSAWLLLGNAGTVDGTNFIGTTDNIPFNIRVNNQKAGRIDQTLSNTFWGYLAGNANTTGNHNTATGVAAIVSNTTGGYNTATGYGASNDNTTGSYNTATGYGALLDNKTGSDNTALGHFAYAMTAGTAFNNSMALGANVIISASNQVRIGDAVLTGSIGGRVAWSVISDARFKKDVKENVPGLAFITKLRPVTYHMNMDGLASLLGTPDSLRSKEAEALSAKEIHTGFIAQEVEKAAQELGFDFSGVDKPKNESDYYCLRYASFTVPLVKAVQEQQKIIDSQQSTIDHLQTTVGSLQTENENMKSEIQKIKTEQQKEISELKAMVEKLTQKEYAASK